MGLSKGIKVVQTELEAPQRLRSKRRGELIHKALSLYEPNRGLRWAVEAAFSALEEPLEGWSMEELLRPLERLLQIPKVKEWLSREGFDELEVVDRDGGLHRLDKVIVSEEEVEVLEYKTGDPEGSHREQLKGYLRLLKEIFPEKVLKGFLLYVDHGFVEEVPLEDTEQ